MGNDLLTRLSNKYGCDKSDRNHKYTPIYHRYFEKDRHREFNMLEFGFGQGKSIKMWMDYFTKANIVNVDIRKELPEDKLIQKHLRNGRFEFFSADQIDMDKIFKISYKYSKFYLIVDDASHVAEDQQYTFSCLFEYVEPGGFYVIEDLKCKRSHSDRFKCKSDKTLKILENYLRTGVFNSKILNNYENSLVSKDIESIKVYDKIAFIRKR